MDVRSATAGLAALAAGLFAAIVLASAPAFAQDDLPGRVGRLADVGGRVFLAPEDKSTDWFEAFRNYTVTTGDNLWVEAGGRAEIDYGAGQFRLAGETSLHVSRLDDRALALFVAQGSVIVRVRFLEPGETVRADTPNAQVALTRPGLYRIDVPPDRALTAVVVRDGEAMAALAGGGAQQLLAGQAATIAGPEPVYADVRGAWGIDGFDAWSADRDRRYDRARSVTYVSPQMIGYADLDDYGRWESSGEYGSVWFPSAMPGDWAPYRFGRWAWVGGWGWTWVDDAPWGYAPFHYGRWVFVGSRWGWAPGGFVPRPLWAPALVGWYGGAGWSFSASYGAPVYGWVPLAWGEPYLPPWRNCSHRCWTMYNRPYAVNRAERPNAPPTHYANWSAPGGVTAVAGATFMGGKPVHREIVRVQPGALASAPVLPGPVLTKPAPGRIPGAKAPLGATPPPASTFHPTTKPAAAPPGEPVVVPPGTGAPAARPGTWGGLPPAPSRPSGTIAAPPSEGRPAPAVPPAQRHGGTASPAQAGAYTPAPGTWGAPGTPVPRGTSPPAPGVPGGRATWPSPPPPPSSAVAPGAALGAGGPGTAAAPSPGTTSPRPGPQGGLQRGAPPASPGQGSGAPASGLQRPAPPSPVGGTPMPRGIAPPVTGARPAPAPITGGTPMPRPAPSPRAAPPGVAPGGLGQPPAVAPAPRGAAGPGPQPAPAAPPAGGGREPHGDKPAPRGGADRSPSPGPN